MKSSSDSIVLSRTLWANRGKRVKLTLPNSRHVEGKLIYVGQKVTKLTVGNDDKVVTVKTKRIREVFPLEGE